MSWKRIAALCISLLIPTGAEAQSTSWVASGFEDQPTSTAPIIEGDDRIRETRREVRFRLDVEHQFGDDVSDDNGLHRLGAARAFVSDTAPTAIVQNDHDNTGGGGATTLTVSPSNRTVSVDGANEVLGDGRLWIDSDGPEATGSQSVAVDGDFDDSTLFVWDTTSNSFVIAKTQHFSTVPPGSVNLIYNGGFDLWNVTAPAAGGNTGWTLVNTPTTLALEANTNSEDVGDGNHLRMIDTGQANSGISQTLDGLKGNTTYMAVAIVQDDVEVCDFTSTGGSSNFSLASDDSGNWQKLAGTFVTNTDGTTDVVINLLVNSTTSDCDWNSVGVYEVGNETIGPNWPPGSTSIVVEQDTDTTIDQDMNSSVFTIHPNIAAQSVVPSRPGQVILVLSTACWESDSTGNVTIDFRIRQTSPSATTVSSASTNNYNEVQATGCQTMFYFVAIPTVGDTYTFELQGLAEAVNIDWNDAATRSTSNLSVMLLSQ